MRIFNIITLLQLFFFQIAYSQKNTNINKFELINNFLQSKSTINFLQNTNDSIINIIDVDNILTRAKINKWGVKLFNVVSTGDTVLKIKRDGIFCDFLNQKLFYIFSSNKIGKVIYYRIFRPYTGANCYVGIIRKGKKYVVIRRGKGWF